MRLLQCLLRAVGHSAASDPATCSSARNSPERDALMRFVAL